MNVKNAYFSLDIRNDGTYIELYPATNGGKPLTIDAVTKYFSHIHFDDYDKAKLMTELKSKNYSGTIKLTSRAIAPVSETMIVEIDGSELEAYCTFYAPSSRGKTLTKEDIVEELNRNKVNYGIDHNLIEEWVNHREYNKELVIAKGREPIQGKNGAVKYCFNTNLQMHPKINEDGTVDYRKLDNMEHIVEGAKLAFIIPAIPGKSGMLVTGKAIPAAKIKTPKLKHGQNIRLSEDGRVMYSQVSGHVYLVDDKVFVSNLYEVAADVDASTGDIEYNGDIHIKGSVTSGFSVKATGEIFVEGVVEGSYLESEGPIIIKGGIQGMNKAKIKSASNITAKFVENATVTAGGDIYTEAIMHSHVAASGKVSVQGKKGLVIGGEIHAAESVSFKVAGSPMSAFTEIEVGMDPAIVTEYRELESNLRKIKQEKTQLTQILTIYRQKLEKGVKLSAEQVATVKQVGSRVKEIEQEIAFGKDRVEELGEIILRCNKGKVVVEDKVYPSVKIVISSAVLILKKEEHYCTFYKDGEDVKSKPL